MSEPVPKLILIFAFFLIFMTGTPLTPKTKPNRNEPIRTTYVPGEIPVIIDSAIQTAKASMDTIAGIPPEKRRITNTLLAFEDTLGDYYDAIYPVTVMGYVHPDQKVASEGMDGEEKAKQFIISIYSRRDLYDAIRNTTTTTPDEDRLLELTLREFKKNGLDLPDDQLKEVRELKEQVTTLEAKFTSNLNNDTTTLEFTEGELSGLPPETIATFKKQNKTYLVTTKYPDYYAVMQNASLSKTRRRMLSAFVNRQADKNPALLEQAIALRKQIAEKLGYQTWVDYRTDGRMAKNGSNVITFLNTLKDPLREKTRAELSDLLTLKQRMDPHATSLDPWDILYLNEQLKKHKYGVNSEEIRRYFPAQESITAMFDQFSSILGVKFEKISDAKAWSPDVSLYKVLNASDNRTCAYIYFDLFPREGKYGHTMMSPLINGRILQNGEYSVPVSVIVGNMRGPDGDTPSLLSVDDLEGLFHEFGHTMHHSLTTVPYADLAGTNVEWDFVEMPSQMFEEWIFDPAVLENVSGHYQDRTKKLPREMIQKIVDSRNIDRGQSYASRYIYSDLDISSYIHPEPVNITGLYNRIYLEMMGIEPIEGNHVAGTIDHFMGGYDAGYYSYLWSNVYSLCGLKQFKQEGMTNTTTGSRFRHWILELGNTKDGMALLAGFLGEEPGPEALFTFLGVNPKTGQR